MRRTPRSRERGAALLVVLVLLVAMAWFALSGFRITGQHMQIVGNSQARQNSMAAAQRGIEQTISNNLFATDPTAVAAAPIETDIDGDGTVDFVAVLTPTPKCYRVRTIKTAELDWAGNPEDRNCLKSSGTGGPILTEKPGAVVTAGDSMCANSEWRVRSEVTDTVSSAKVAVEQGIAIRVVSSDAANFCK